MGNCCSNSKIDAKAVAKKRIVSIPSQLESIEEDIKTVKEEDEPRTNFSLPIITPNTKIFINNKDRSHIAKKLNSDRHHKLPHGNIIFSVRNLENENTIKIVGENDDVQKDVNPELKGHLQPSPPRITKQVSENFKAKKEKMKMQFNSLFTNSRNSFAVVNKGKEQGELNSSSLNKEKKKPTNLLKTIENLSSIIKRKSRQLDELVLMKDQFQKISGNTKEKQDADCNRVEEIKKNKVEKQFTLSKAFKADNMTSSSDDDDSSYSESKRQNLIAIPRFRNSIAVSNDMKSKHRIDLPSQVNKMKPQVITKSTRLLPPSLCNLNSQVNLPRVPVLKQPSIRKSLQINEDQNDKREEIFKDLRKEFLLSTKLIDHANPMNMGGSSKRLIVHPNSFANLHQSPSTVKVLPDDILKEPSIKMKSRLSPDSVSFKNASLKSVKKATKIPSKNSIVRKTQIGRVSIIVSDGGKSDNGSNSGYGCLSLRDYEDGLSDREVLHMLDLPRHHKRSLSLLIS